MVLFINLNVKHLSHLRNPLIDDDHPDDHVDDHPYHPSQPKVNHNHLNGYYLNAHSATLNAHIDNLTTKLILATTM